MNSLVATFNLLGLAAVLAEAGERTRVIDKIRRTIATR